MEGASYFDLGSRLESSPTSSLVADLSQNFHIDKTFVPFRWACPIIRNFRIVNVNIGPSTRRLDDLSSPLASMGVVSVICSWSDSILADPSSVCHHPSNSYFISNR